MTIVENRGQVPGAAQDVPLIEARGIIKHYDGFSLDNVSLSVGEGEVVGFVGKNGAGKSTTIKALLGLVKLDGGEGSILGVPSNELSRPVHAGTKERIGVVFDTISMPGHLRVADVGRVFSHAYASWNPRMFEQLTHDFDLTATKQVKELSRGMGMKLSLACALSHDARVLILDEATAGLDPMARDELLDRLLDFVAMPGRAILMSSHITSDLERIADRVLGIDGGRIIFDLAKDEITDEMGIARCRVAEFERICASGIIPEGQLRYRKNDYGIDLLVPDRFVFAEMKRAYLMEMTIFRDYIKQLMGVGFFVSIFVSAGMGSIVAAPAILTMMDFMMGCMSASAYDEQSNWGAFRLTMPVSRRDVVLGRYGVIVTLGFLGMAAGWVACLLILALGSVVELPFGLSDAIAFDEGMFLGAVFSTAFCMALGSLIASIETPIYFKFGQNKTTQWLPMITVLLFVGPMLIINGTGILDNGSMSFGNLASLLGFIETPVGVATCFAIFLAFTVVVLGISAAVSLKLYEGREL